LRGPGGWGKIRRELPENRTMRALPCCLAVVFLASACGGSSVQRVDADSTVDLSGRWNDTDARLVATGLIQEFLASERFQEFAEKHGDTPPSVIIGTVVNRSLEHIDVRLLGDQFERAISDSGKVTFVANASERGELRREKVDQLSNASQDTRKDLGQERGADLMLKGEITSIADAAGGKTMVYYQVNLKLIDLLTNEKVWVGEKKVKKVIGR